MTRIPGVLFCGLVLAHCWTSPTSASPFDEPGFHIKLTERLGLMWTPRYPMSAIADELSITRLAPGGMPLDLAFLDPAESILLTVSEVMGNQEIYMALKWSDACVAVRATTAAQQPGDYVVVDATGEVVGPLDAAALAETLAGCGIGAGEPWHTPREAHAFSIATFPGQPEHAYLNEQAREAAIFAGVVLLFIFSGIGLLCRHILRRRKVAAWRASWIGLAVWLFFPAAGAGLIYWALATAAI